MTFFKIVPKDRVKLFLEASHKLNSFKVLIKKMEQLGNSSPSRNHIESFHENCVF